eukprot:m.341081 g.341081  ORF g.341081 m.341081 type:complete len:51 (-) comp20605_c0_seq3:181-333(-)
MFKHGTFSLSLMDDLRRGFKSFDPVLDVLCTECRLAMLPARPSFGSGEHA